MPAGRKFINRDWKRNAFAITTHDTNELSETISELYVGGAGNVRVMFADDSTAVTFTAVPVGTTIRGRIKQVLATGTTATNLVGVV